MQHSHARHSQSVKIRLLEELVERNYAHLWHFAVSREKEAERAHHDLPATETSMAIKHRQQKRIYRDCVAYAAREESRVLCRIWKDRADDMYAAADFVGLVALRRLIEAHLFESEEYFDILEERHKILQADIDTIRESNRQIRVEKTREKAARHRSE